MSISVDSTQAPVASVVLNVMANVELALYGFRSWMLQDFDRPYEVVLSVFNDKQGSFEPLTAGANRNCRAIFKTVAPPAFFNISAANNLGLHLSSGRYVVFANADMVYCGDFLSRAIGEMERRDVCYAIASRVNLTKEQCAALKPPSDYAGPHAFDDLIKLRETPGVTTWPALSPWMFRRDVIYAIGGFDPAVLVAEDRDIDWRAAHYLRRKNLQHADISFSNLHGFHLYHTNTHLYDANKQSRAVMNARKQRMDADPEGADDVVPNKLDDLASLEDEVRRTKKPPTLNRYRQNLRQRLARRANDVWHVLLHGR